MQERNTSLQIESRAILKIKKRSDFSLLPKQIKVEIHGRYRQRGQLEANSDRLTLSPQWRDAHDPHRNGEEDLRDAGLH